jgi:hypothetical protein
MTRLMRALLCLVVLLVGVGCGASGPWAARTLPMPDDSSVRGRALDELGRRAFGALASGDGSGLLLDDDAMRSVLQPAAASQAAVVRSGGFEAAPDSGSVLRGATYVGLCVQRARTEGAGGRAGLREPGFLLERVLVVGADPGGGRIAAWVEGTFVLTDRGFYALALQRLELPRRDHADLEIAPCDFQIGVRSPRPVVVSGADWH